MPGQAAPDRLGCCQISSQRPPSPGRAAALGVQLRAGIHTGEVDPLGDAIAGISVHIAGRLAAPARPAEILVSRTVGDLVTGSGISFSERGGHELNGEGEPWALVRGWPG
jgi:class 3 adenylate cyclase